jgi:lipid-A-disaccharide synthase
LPDEAFEECGTFVNVQLIKGQTYSILAQADAALVTSGTATLETALFGVPEVVCYKGNPISYFIARSLIKVKFISLVNLILDRELVKELIQFDLNAENLNKALHNILIPSEQHKIRLGYQELKAKLGNEGASERAAKEICDFVSKQIG